VWFRGRCCGVWPCAPDNPRANPVAMHRPSAGSVFLLDGGLTIKDAADQLAARIAKGLQLCPGFRRHARAALAEPNQIGQTWSPSKTASGTSAGATRPEYQIVNPAPVVERIPPFSGRSNSPHPAADVNDGCELSAVSCWPPSRACLMRIGHKCLFVLVANVCGGGGEFNPLGEPFGEVSLGVFRLSRRRFGSDGKDSRNPVRLACLGQKANPGDRPPLRRRKCHHKPIRGLAERLINGLYTSSKSEMPTERAQHHPSFSNRRRVVRTGAA